MPHPELSIARVQSSTGRFVGLAFAIDNDHLATCAHVVNVALSRDKRETSMPAARGVRLVFPFIADHDPVEATVIRWGPRNNASFDHHDIAVLRLAGGLPEGVVPVPIGTADRVGEVQMCGPTTGRSRASGRASRSTP